MKATALRSDLLMNGETNHKSGIAPTVMKLGNLVRMVLCSFGMPASMTWKSLKRTVCFIGLRAGVLMIMLAWVS